MTMIDPIQLSLPIQTKKPPPDLPQDTAERVVEAVARLIRQIDEDERGRDRANDG